MEFADHNESAAAYNKYYASIERSVKDIREKDPEFYRMDMDFRESPVIGMNQFLAIGSGSVSQYTSTNNTAVAELFKDLGYAGDMTIVSYESILPIDALFGVKYIFSREDILRGELYSCPKFIEGKKRGHN